MSSDSASPKVQSGPRAGNVWYQWCPWGWESGGNNRTAWSSTNIIWLSIDWRGQNNYYRSYRLYVGQLCFNGFNLSKNKINKLKLGKNSYMTPDPCFRGIKVTCWHKLPWGSLPIVKLWLTTEWYFREKGIWFINTRKNRKNIFLQIKEMLQAY